MTRLGLGTCLLLLTAARLGGTYPALDLINLAAAPLAMSSVVLAGFMLFRARTWIGRALACACIVPGLLVLLPERASPAMCDGTAQRLRVAWINAHHPRQAGPIAAWLDAENPQVVGVAELRRDLPLRKVLRRRYPYWSSCLGNGRCSTLLYSRVAPAEMDALARGDPQNRRALSAVRMALAPRGTGVGARSALPDQIFAVHLSRPLPLGCQREELLELEQRLGLSAGTIVMGDLNMSPRMDLLRNFASRNGLKLTRTDRPTWPASIGRHSLPGLWQIDHLLVGAGWHVAAIRTGPDLGSDHRGFVADLCRTTT